jgi:hypothetical protein
MAGGGRLGALQQPRRHSFRSRSLCRGRGEGVQAVQSSSERASKGTVGSTFVYDET